MAEAVPGVSVFYERAKVMHDAAISSVDKKWVETLISHGPNESEAVDVIVRGLLNPLYRPLLHFVRVYSDNRPLKHLIHSLPQFLHT